MTQVVKLYDVIRSAHFERIRDDVTTTVLYKSHRYDFDPSLTSGVHLLKRGVLGAFWFTLGHDIDVLEINEPLMVSAAPRTLAALVGARLRTLVRRRQTVRVITYAIENKDPGELIPTLPIHARIRWRICSSLVPRIWPSIDRIAFGTEGSHRLYRANFSSQQWPEMRVISAVPAPHPDAMNGEMTRGPVAVFLGDLAPRKGFPLVAESWQQVAASVVGARLIVIGKGSGLSDARELARSQPNIELHIDPPRGEIIGLISKAKVLLLPSQPTPRWREQVGLPIVEALSVGCEIVTTDETGLADWLGNNGHRVLRVPTSVGALVEATIAALNDGRSPEQILASLPAIDGRRAADDWLVEGAN